MPSTYKTPDAFRQALEARLRTRVQKEGLDLQWLRRQVAFERLLARVFHPSDSIWWLKGGYALELRLRQQARTTLDIDLMIADTEALRTVTQSSPAEEIPDLAYDYLQTLAAIDLDDFFQYLIARPRVLTAAPEGGMRCSVDCRIGGKTFASFHVDIGLGDTVLGEPEWVSGPGFLEFAGAVAPRIQLLPVAQQIAEKFHAYTYPWEGRVNTRVKDLVDLVLLFETQTLDLEELNESIVATFQQRDTHPLPTTLPQPPAEWANSFEALSEELGLPVVSLRQAYDYIQGQWKNLR